MVRLSLAAAFLLAACGSKAPGAPEIHVTSGWARPTSVPGAPAAAYLSMHNGGTAPDRLVGVDAPAPIAASLHRTSQENGVASMRPLAHLDIAPDQELKLEPGGAHIMLNGLTRPLREGDVLRLTLRFERSGARPVDIEVTGTNGGGHAH